MSRESWAVAYGTYAGLTMGAAFSCFFHPLSVGLIVVFGVATVVALLIGVTRRDSISQPGERIEPREGVLTVYDHEGRYVGCIGAETWQDLIAREAANSQEDAE